jgi:hypothetical protein
MEHLLSKVSPFKSVHFAMLRKDNSLFQGFDSWLPRTHFFSIPLSSRKVNICNIFWVEYGIRDCLVAVCGIKVN